MNQNIIRNIVLFFIFLNFSNLVLSESTSTRGLDADQKALLESLPPDQRASILGKMNKEMEIEDELEDVYKNESTLVQRPELEDEDQDIPDCKECIFGYEFFKYSPSTFAQVSSIPISSDYILGPGDKLQITLFGNANTQFESFITREGLVFLPNLGPVNLLGLTFEDATKLIKNKVKSELIGTEVSISLKQLRSISIYLLGEAYKPGSYTVSGLSSVSNALFVSGGVNKNGSLRNIQVRRNNKTVAEYDFYEFLLKGSLESDIRLQDGDIIFIPFIERRVKVGGAFRRPATFEFKDGESISDAIFLAGGFTSQVVEGQQLELGYIDRESYERKVTYIADYKKEDRMLQDGDTINISSKSGMTPETIKVTGQVLNPGEFSIQPGETILSILQRAGGITEDGYSEGAVFLRESVAEEQKSAFIRSADELEDTMIDIVTKGAIDNISEFTLTPISRLVAKLREAEPPGRMVVDLNYLSLKTDPGLNFRVQGGDTLHIPKRPNSISVVGEVLNASTLSFDPKKGVEDYIASSGGLNESADKEKIFIILPNGQSQLTKSSFFSTRYVLLPGSTIVVSRDPRPFDAISITQIITPILADLATSAAAIAAISN
jgi:protein involved in polysaccharide export with SLBB domain